MPILSRPTAKTFIRRIVLPPLTVLCLCLTTFAQSASRRVDDYVRAAMSRRQILGMAVAVVKNGRVLKAKGYGAASVEFDIPADADSIFQIYSVSKIFAGVAVMKLVEDGRLSLNSPVNEVVGTLPPAWKGVTVRHLLTHTSGLAEASSNPRHAALPEHKRKGLSAAETIDFVSEVPLKFEPGEKFSYGQSAYVLLGLVVEKVAGKSYESFLSERVFAPLRMASTRFGETEVVIKRRSPTAYNRETGSLRGWLFPFTPKDYPGAGLNSSANDLAGFFAALDAGRVLMPESLAALWSPFKLRDGTERNYGLGWTIDARAGRKVVGHEGGGSAWVAHFPAERLSVVVLCNLNGVRADEIQYDIADIYLKRQ